MTGSPLPPIRRSISVSWDPETAFRRFTAEFGSWWPSRTHSIGGDRIRRIVFETRVGGRIYEEHRDGRRFQWGRITVWEPPRRVQFTWHPSRDEATAQDVDLRFLPEGSGTRLELTAAGWERWGKDAARARRGYSLGWATVLDRWAERRTGRLVLAAGLSRLIRVYQQLTGKVEATIDQAGGEITGT